MAKRLRKVRFNFGGDGGPFDKVFDGLTDDTYWNGWLNVWVTADVYAREVRPHMMGGAHPDLKPGVNDESIAELDQQLLECALNPDGPGLVSLGYCYTTCEIKTKVQAKVDDILSDAIECLEGAIEQGPAPDPDNPTDDLWGWVELAKENLECAKALALTNRCDAHRALQLTYGLERLIHEGKPVAGLRGGIAEVVTHLERIMNETTEWNGPINVE
jgi:hypothetical protein